MAKIKDEIEAPKAELPKEIDRKDLVDCVNQIKLDQAIAAVSGKGKCDSTDKELAVKARVAGLAGADAVRFVYAGRKGLIESVKDQEARVAKANKKYRRK